MKSVWNKIWIYPISVVLFVVFFFLHYIFVYDGANNSQDFWLMDAYRWLGLILFITMFLSVICLSFYGYPDDEGIIGFFARLKRIFTLTIEKTFFVVILFFGLIYAFVLPPLSAPDEVSHYISAYQLSNTLLFQESNTETGHVLIRSEDLSIEDVEKDYRLTKSEVGNQVYFSKENKEDLSVVLSQTLYESDYDYIYKNFNYMDDGENFLGVSEFPPVRTTPIPYLASAIGISIARVLNLGSIYLLFFGRLFNFLTFVILMTIAMKLLPMYKEILFGVTLLPMSLHLAASFSYDSFIFAMYAIFVSYVLHLRFKAERVRIIDLVCITILLILVAPCKIVYAPLALLAFLVPKEKFGSTKFYTISILTVSIGMLLSIFITNLFMIRLYTLETNIVPWAGEESVSLGFMLHNPFKILQLIYNTFVYQLGEYHSGLIGQYLGNLDRVLDSSYFVVIVSTLCLLALGLSKNDEELRLFAPQKWLIFFVILLSVGLIKFSMLLAWTPITSDFIEGVQGRYFLPLLPLTLMLLKQKLIVFTVQKNRMALIALVMTNVFVLLRMFSIISIRL